MFRNPNYSPVKEPASICRFLSRRTSMRPIIRLLLLSAPLLTGHATASVLTIYGDTADTKVHKNGIFTGDPGQNGGQSGFNGGFDYSMVFVLQLPVLSVNQTITSADFSFYNTASGSTFDTDLYGLSYRALPTVLASDWYTGTGDPNNTLIQAGIVPPSFSNQGRFSTSASGDAALLSFILAQYASGALGGEYVFLRLSTNAAQAVNLNVNFYYAADVAFFLAGVYGQSTLARWQNDFSPRLLLTIEETQTPEPCTLAAVALSLAALMVFRQRGQPR